MRRISDEQIKGAMGYLQDQFDGSGYSGWLEGWACGYTDPEHGYENTDEVHDKLFNFLEKLRGE